MKFKIMNKMDIVVLILLLLSMITGVIIGYNACEYNIKKPQPIIYVLDYKNKSPFEGKNPKEYLMFALDYYNIKHKDIVYKQAVLESGLGSSKIYKRTNNLFGLYNSRKKDYYSFSSWEESVIAYKIYIQSKYKGGDYYEFLKNMGYAEDEHYIEKLKNIK